jgi:hypothetical protein
MIFDPQHVKKALRQKILWGYDPEWDLESVEDHDTDWMAIPKQEFHRIKKAAQLEKKQQAREVSACQACALR